MKTKKILRILGTMALLAGFTGTIVSCKDNDQSKTEEVTNCVVTFNTGKGSKVESQNVLVNGLVTMPQNPTLDGYIFGGWFTDETYKTAWDFKKQKVTSNVTIYAKWEKIHSVSEIIELCGTEAGEPSVERYYVKATIKEIINPEYGEMIITDETGSLSVYGTYSADGKKRYNELEDKPYANDEVLLYGTVQNYNGTPQIKSGWIISFEKGQIDIDLSKYKEMNIASSREAKDNTLIKTSGVVTRITYAFGMIPNGFMLVDGTEAIYVYDTQIASQVKEGNEVTIAAKKDFWILADEKDNAKKYGYNGCNQLTDVYLLANEESNKTFDKSFVKETTIKSLLEVKPNVLETSTIYKVNALVSKEEGSGFNNYYFYDLDGKTGSYTYTQNNGSDFSWLDEFNGKICTVYLSVLNAKSTDSGLVYRFLPIAVEDNGYKFDVANAPQFALDYYVANQFRDVYAASETQEVINTLSSELLGFKDLKITYKSQDSAIIFTDDQNKTLMKVNLSADKDVKIKVTATLGNNQASMDITLKLRNPENVQTISVSDAINKQNGDEVIVKGIVTSSLVNQIGFYISDATGIMAVRVSQEVMNSIRLGDEIILKGLRTDFSSKPQPITTQICITEVEILFNLGGNKEYDTTSFESTKTLSDLIAIKELDPKYTAQGYIVKATVKFVDAGYYKNVTLVTGEERLSLYCSDSNQYAFLEAFNGQEVTLELALCNWNNKKYYAGCVIAVVNADGTKVVNSLNF